MGIRTYSNATWETRTNNVNGQLASIGWPTGYGVNQIQYVFAATQNNGQITQEVDSYPYNNYAAQTTEYQYDPLKRLTAAAMTVGSGTPAMSPWTETFQYDGFGNLSGRVLNGSSTPQPANAATNRLTNG